jgi:shikimate kinase
MSGSGKTTWSIKLANTGFRRFCCDELIAEKLVHELTGPAGKPMELGEWMGFPYQPTYKERESKYLACEIEVLNEILEFLEAAEEPEGQNIVVDTTGSVIYTGHAILKRLRARTMVIHLSTPPKVQDLMLKAYLENRRPVLWRNLFTQKRGESNDDALARCYPGLLASREGLYEQNAGITVDYDTLSRCDFSVKEFLDFVKVTSGRT